MSARLLFSLLTHRSNMPISSRDVLHHHDIQRDFLTQWKFGERSEAGVPSDTACLMSKQ